MSADGNTNKKALVFSVSYAGIRKKSVKVLTESLMDQAEVKVEMPEDRPLEPLVIVEEGDVTDRGTVSSEAVTVQLISGLPALPPKEDGQTGEDESGGSVPSETCLEDRSLPKQQTTTEGGQAADEEIDEVGRSEDIESVRDGQNKDIEEREGQAQEEVPENKVTEQDLATPADLQVYLNRLTASDQPPEETQSSPDAQKQARRLTPDFPDALYELLFAFQEGRRLNDQRCSFRLKGGMARRRCHSEPNTTKPANRVIFSSMTSLQREEFFEFVATTQARRLDNQRAELQRSPTRKPKTKSFRGSLKQLSIVRKPAPPPPPAPVPKDELYNMILTTQAQGRLEDQRSRAPGPMDDEDFFSLLLKVQGGRMDEQRTELPHILQT
ncbi:uncharacterized protein gpsm3 isoform 1-T1 [Polymixia lowei]